MAKIKIIGLDKLFAKLDAVKKEEVLTDTLKNSADFMISWITKERMSGPRPKILGVRTGNLRASIMRSDVEKTEGGFRVRIGPNEQMPSYVYARIHEYGGTIKPKTKKFLRWQNPDTKQWFSAKQVTIPARPYLRPVIEESANQEMIVEVLKEHINKALET